MEEKRKEQEETKYCIRAHIAPASRKSTDHGLRFQKHENVKKNPFLSYQPPNRLTFRPHNMTLVMADSDDTRNDFHNKYTTLFKILIK